MNTPDCTFLRTDFGHEVYDGWYLNNGNYNFESPEFVRRHLPFYEKALQLTKEDRILEAGCGIGSYSREFARKGYNVVGMDLSNNFLSEARNITQSENLEIEYILGDYNEINFKDDFSILFFEGSFFYQSKEGLITLLKRIYQALMPNGRLYFVHPNPTILNKQFPMDDWTEIDKDLYVLQKTVYDECDDVERTTWLKIDLVTQKHYRCDYILKHLSHNELDNCLVDAGFAEIHYYKKRRLEIFQPDIDNSFSVVAKK